ncbi:hypothetical protein EJB05_56648, partial [Eragrostis curvula]
MNLNGERDRPADRAGNSAPRGRGGRAGRGGRSREGVWKRKAKENDLTVSRKRGSGEAWLDGDKDEELKDTASSPLKPIAEDAKTSNGEQSARKHLDMSAELERVPPPPPTYISPRDKKKAKASSALTSTNLAGSGEECRPDQ